MAKKEKKPEVKLERVYNVPLRKEWLKVPKYKRSKKALAALKQFLAKFAEEMVKLKINANHVKVQEKYLRLGLFWKEKSKKRSRRISNTHVEVVLEQENCHIHVRNVVGTKTFISMKSNQFHLNR